MGKFHWFAGVAVVVASSGACGSSEQSGPASTPDAIDDVIAGRIDGETAARAAALRREFSEEEARYLRVLPWQSMTDERAIADVEVRRLLRHSVSSAAVAETPLTFQSAGGFELRPRALLGEQICGPEACAKQCSAFEKALWRLADWGRRVRDNCLNLRPWYECWAGFGKKVAETVKLAEGYGGVLNALLDCQTDLALTCAAADEANASTKTLRPLGPTGRSCPVPRRPTTTVTDGGVAGGGDAGSEAGADCGSFPSTGGTIGMSWGASTVGGCNTTTAYSCGYTFAPFDGTKAGPVNRTDDPLSVMTFSPADCTISGPRSATSNAACPSPIVVINVKTLACETARGGMSGGTYCCAMQPATCGFGSGGVKCPRP